MGFMVYGILGSRSLKAGDLQGGWRRRDRHCALASTSAGLSPLSSSPQSFPSCSFLATVHFSIYVREEPVSMQHPQIEIDIDEFLERVIFHQKFSESIII